MEVQKLHSTTTSSIIASLKPMFAQHGIPATLISDNGPQFSLVEMKEFAEAYRFHHITASVYYSRVNGQAKHTVCTVKNLLKNAKDLYGITKLSYNTTSMVWT